MSVPNGVSKDKKGVATTESVNMEHLLLIAQEMNALRNSNQVQISLLVTDKKQNPGKEKLDSDGMPTGEFWDDSYWLSLEGMGVKINKAFPKAIFESVQIGETYIFTGRLELKSKDNRTYLDVNLHQVENIHDRLSEFARSMS